MFGRILALWLLICLGGCSLLPAMSPTPEQLVRTDDQEWDAYMVKVNARITRALAGSQEPGFPDTFRVGNYTPSVVLKPGDTIGVTVYENSSQPLFGSPVPPLMTGVPGQPMPQSTTLPLQIVENDGTVIVPYVGRVRVAGRTPANAAALIQDGLGKETIRPQVVVSLVNNVSNTVAVGGEVSKPGLMPLTLRGERLLDAIAWGGGPKWPPGQIDVRLMRGNTVATVPLSQVMANPTDNVVARPNDSITLVRHPKLFVVMGATQKVSQFTFDYEKVTLAEGLAQGGGGIDTISNLAGVFLFRYETGPVARKVLDSDPKAVEASYTKSQSTLAEGAPVPMVYRIDLTQADGYFFAQQIALRDKDIVLVANSQTTQFLKVMQIVRALTGTYYDIKRNSTN